MHEQSKHSSANSQNTDNTNTTHYRTGAPAPSSSVLSVLGFTLMQDCQIFCGVKISVIYCGIIMRSKFMNVLIGVKVV